MIAGGPRPSGSTRRPVLEDRDLDRRGGPAPGGAEARPRLGRHRPPAEPDLHRALGRPELAVEYGKSVLAVDPGDTETITRLVDYYTKQERPRGAEALLKEVLANPKLDAARAGPAARRVRAGQALRRPAQADRQGGRRLRQGRRPASTRRRPTGSRRADQARILGDDPADGLPRLRHGLPRGQAVRPGRQGVRARAGLRRGQPADPPAPGRDPAED